MNLTEKLSDHEKSILKQCLVDLQTIESVIKKSKITWQDIRSIVLPLRMLIVENVLLQCWNLLSKDKTEKLTICAKQLPQETWLDGTIISCGNSEIGTLDQAERIGATLIVPEGFSDNEANKIQNFLDFENKKQCLTMSDYQNSVCLWLHNIEITRQILIKYLANTSGIAHPKRDVSQIKDGKAEKELYIAIETYASKTWINGKNLPYLEAQNIAVQIITSPKVMKLKNLLENEFNNDLDWSFI